MRRFWSGVLATLVLVGFGVLAILVLGVIDFSAAKPAGRLEAKLAPWAVERSIEARAPTQSNPSTTAADVARGQSHYQESCVFCHGAPGNPPDEVAAGLNPSAPTLDAARLARSSDGRLFFIVKNGIRMTGMPAFGHLYDDGEVWKIVAGLRAQATAHHAP